MSLCDAKLPVLNSMIKFSQVLLMWRWTLVSNNIPMKIPTSVTEITRKYEFLIALLYQLYMLMCKASWHDTQSNRPNKIFLSLLAAHTWITRWNLNFAPFLFRKPIDDYEFKKFARKMLQLWLVCLFIRLNCQSTCIRYLISVLEFRCFLRTSVVVSLYMGSIYTCRHKKFIIVRKIRPFSLSSGK